jgi:hypothetical protein
MTPAVTSGDPMQDIQLFMALLIIYELVRIHAR